jgi:hypothetical protein
MAGGNNVNCVEQALCLDSALYKKSLNFIIIIKFQGIEILYRDIDRVCESVPATQDKIEMLKEYDLPETNEDLDQLLGWIRNRYHDVMK